MAFLVAIIFQEFNHMARKIDVRRILEEKIKGASNNSIASNWYFKSTQSRK